MNPLKSLMTQFILGATVMVAFVLMLTLSQRESTQLQKQLTDWQAQADKIQLEIANLQQQAQHYKLNAPRDFESYNRDVAVFYQQFRQQLATLDNSFNQANSRVTELSNSVAYDWLTQEGSPLLRAIQKQSAWHHFWLVFVDGLEAQLGDPQEPRLEWGAEHIINNQERLSLEATSLAGQIRDAYTWFGITSDKINLGLISIVFAYLLLMLGMLGLRILRPILSTTRACEAVAAGAYGQKVEINGSGETRRLQQAFNELSARSKLMMDMLGDINKPGNVSEKLQSIYDSGHEALGNNWIGLMAFNEQSVELNTSVPTTLDYNFRHRHVSLHKAFGKELSNTLDSGWLNIESLRQLSLTRHDERFLRELHKNTMAHQVVGHPFQCPQHNDYILLFSSNRPEGFSSQQIELIQALSPLMADAIVSGMDQPASHSLIVGDIQPVH
ncbi:HAMP domain-containing protein [Bacterioplanoides sp.]|uniref:HAMP domain-containing protein n=1 Tax=Bacterioplanoides sp. TaxID=2066072 RepID=UPI003AFFE8DD